MKLFLSEEKNNLGNRIYNRSMEDTAMSEEKKSVVTEEVKEARELTEEELEMVTGGNSHCGIYIGDGQMKNGGSTAQCYNNMGLPPKPAEVINDAKQFLDSFG